MFPIETTFVAHDNNKVLMVKLGHETSLAAYSTDKRSKPVKPTVLDGDRVVDALKNVVRELNDVVVSISIIQEIYSTQNVGVDEFKI